MKGTQLFLKPEEANFLSMAVVAMLEGLHDSATNPQINWTPDARKDLKEMLIAGKALAIKLRNLGFDMRKLPPYIDGEEKDYLTKPS